MTTSESNNLHLPAFSPIGKNVLQPSSKHDLNKRDPSAHDESFIKHHHSVKKPQTPSVSRRNARERNRVKLVNNGFSTLRTHIPHLKSKTSKVDTLRAAVDYIRNLRTLLGESLPEEDDKDDYSFTLMPDSHEDSGELSPRSPSNPPSPGLTHPSLPPHPTQDESSNNVLQMVYSLPDYGASGIQAEAPELIDSLASFEHSDQWWVIPPPENDKTQ